jgi:hypothetical protein
MHQYGANVQFWCTVGISRVPEDFMVKLSAFQRTLAHLLMPELLAWFLH